MKPCSAIVFGLCVMSCLTPSIFAGSTLDSSLSSGNWLTTALDQISAERMLADVTALSGPTYRGRQTGSAQDADSAAYVADRFSELRLHRSLASAPQNQTNPLPQREWKQTAPVATRIIETDLLLDLTLPQSRLILHGGSDFLPVLDSPSVDVQAPIIFVGYGLSDPSQNIDDYAGLDVRNKIVLFLRGKPDKYPGTAAHADKERLAKERGAVAYLTATGPILNAYEQRRGVTGRPSAFYSTAEMANQLPGAWISTETAEAILHEGTAGSSTLRSLQEEINRTGSSRSLSTNISAHVKWTTQLTPGTLFNVISIIRGYSDNSEETVLIGAHRDHFGQQAGLLFAGADDNASGTAILLEVARVLALSPVSPKRSILFISFSGEEQGLLGSRLYVSQPVVPLSKTIGMINVDHAGVGNGRLTVGVTGFPKTLAQEIGQLAGLSERLDLFGFFPGGDHVPFKEAGVPTITIVSGGVHPNFHQPTDTVETLNPEILESVARYVLALVWQLANTP
ncbi:MAG TPA: M28 family peptidase [Nitrospira sp.]|nr:M28 family peptidase [Nitrospira sp.]